MTPSVGSPALRTAVTPLNKYIGYEEAAKVIKASMAEGKDLRTVVLERGLMKQKLPEQLEIIDALPRNPTGKIVKFELRDRYAKP